jgi:flagellar basal body-associated protein FliL
MFFKDRSIKALLSMQREIVELRKQNALLKNELKAKKESMREIVRMLKEKCDDYWYI